jgi:hypothetical protein
MLLAELDSIAIWWVRQESLRSNKLKKKNYFLIDLLMHCVNYVDAARVSKVVKVLCYKSEGRWFDPSWCHWNFPLT